MTRVGDTRGEQPEEVTSAKHLGRGVHEGSVAERPRWWRRPRQTIWRWDASRALLLVPIWAAVGWWAFLDSERIALTEDSADSIWTGTRLGTAAWGLLSLGCALLLTGLAVLYVRRPVIDTPARNDPLRLGDGHFRASDPGYAPDEVDALLDQLAGLTPSEIEGARFTVTRPGYDRTHVDLALRQAMKGEG